MHLKGEQEEGKGGDVPSAAAAISALGCTGSCHLLFVISALPADGVTACSGPGAPVAGAPASPALLEQDRICKQDRGANGG